MGVLYVQASFKNSRIAARKPTTSAVTFPVTVPADGLNHQIVPADTTRTYITVRNTSTSDDMRYGYTDDPLLNINGQLMKHDEAGDLESPTGIWARNIGAAAILVLCDEGHG